MQSAALSFLPWKQMTGKEERTFPARLDGHGGEGVYVIVDLREEQVGLLDLDFTVPANARWRSDMESIWPMDAAARQYGISLWR